MTRFLLYSHDTYGLGHLRRCCLVASGLTSLDPRNEVLIVTGSPRAQSSQLPSGVDTVKLPTATKDRSGAYRPRKLHGSIDRLIELRGELIRSVASSYAPDVILIDHSPLGMGGELSAMLRQVSRATRRPRMVLGLRDIVDAADRVDWAWHRDGVWDALAAYDEILVYGDASVRTTAIELGIGRRVDATVTHTGFVAPRMPDPATDDPFVLVTPGGGGDGQRLLRGYLDAVEAGASAHLRSIVVTGPLMSARRRAELVMRAEHLPSVQLVETSDRMRSLIASAEAVVSMAGYNTVVEELAAGTPSLLVPRRHPRVEQHIRSVRLAAVSDTLHHCPIEELSPARVSRFIADALDAPRRSSELDLDGVDSVARRLSDSSRPSREPSPCMIPPETRTDSTWATSSSSTPGCRRRSS